MARMCPECDKENKDDAEDCAACGFNITGFTHFFRFQKAADKAREKERVELEKNNPAPKKKGPLSFLGGNK